MPPTLQDCWPRRSASLRSWVVFAAVVGMVVVEALFAMCSGGRRVGKGTPVTILRPAFHDVQSETGGLPMAERPFMLDQGRLHDQCRTGPSRATRAGAP